MRRKVEFFSVQFDSIGSLADWVGIIVSLIGILATVITIWITFKQFQKESNEQVKIIIKKKKIGTESFLVLSLLNIGKTSLYSKFYGIKSKTISQSHYIANHGALSPNQISYYYDVETFFEKLSAHSRDSELPELILPNEYSKETMINLSLLNLDRCKELDVYVLYFDYARDKVYKERLSKLI